MESTIIRHLHPEFSPLAVVWNNTIPEDVLQFKDGKFGCILSLLAEADLVALRAVLGMLGIDDRKVMRKRFRNVQFYNTIN